MGNSVFRYFLEWLKGELGMDLEGKGGFHQLLRQEFFFEQSEFLIPPACVAH